MSCIVCPLLRLSTCAKLIHLLTPFNAFRSNSRGGRKKGKPTGKTAKPRRFTFLVNVWLSYKPAPTQLLPDSVAKRLSPVLAQSPMRLDPRAEERATQVHQLHSTSVDPCHSWSDLVVWYTGGRWRGVSAVRTALLEGVARGRRLPSAAVYAGWVWAGWSLNFSAFVIRGSTSNPHNKIDSIVNNSDLLFTVFRSHRIRESN